MESRVFTSIYGMNLIHRNRYTENLCVSKQTKPKNKNTFDYEGEDTGCTTALEDARESFRIGTYLPIIDTLIAEVRR